MTNELLTITATVSVNGTPVNLDRLDDLRADATRERLVGAELAAEAVRETWRKLEEFNLTPQLALEALFVEISQELRA